MKNVVSEDVTGARDQQVLAEVDRLMSEIKVMLEESTEGMKRARRADQKLENQLRELERQMQCWND